MTGHEKQLPGFCWRNAVSLSRWNPVAFKCSHRAVGNKLRSLNYETDFSEREVTRQGREGREAVLEELFWRESMHFGGVFTIKLQSGKHTHLYKWRSESGKKCCCIIHKTVRLFQIIVSGRKAPPQERRSPRGLVNVGT